MEMMSQEVFTLFAAGLLTALIFGWRYCIVSWRDASQTSAKITAETTVNPLNGIAIVYASQKGTARQLAHKLFNKINTWRRQQTERATFFNDPLIFDAGSFDVENIPKFKVVFFVVATYTDGHAPESAQQFEKDLNDVAQDFRYGGGFLSSTFVAVFGLGDAAFGHNFNSFAKNVTDCLQSLGAKELTASCYAPEKRQQVMFTSFTAKVLTAMETRIEKEKRAAVASQEPSSGCTTCSTCTCGTKQGNEKMESESDNGDGGGEEEAAVEDVEDMAADDDLDENRAGRELLYPKLRENLTKQGYRLLGSHSGVKLCRWTKAMLRGRGGCYKHTFYNIASYQCMEMTPSLACANKCVFCWRHHTNPVGKTFQWKVDPPEFLVEEALAAHRGMLRPLRGVPGLNLDRLNEAMNVRHCALSLVGEPIMYPEINRFVDILHDKNISTFLVTNAQFPDRVRDLHRVTQLYLSIDAATPESLKRIDRPLFEDYWERMLGSIQEMRRTMQRTVFRLTLVGSYNMDTISEYCSLINMGCPDFVEVKGVTYCGVNEASPITMKHVPFHKEVVGFCSAVVDQLNAGTSRDASGKPGRYLIACEHEHSCCVLIAHERFRINEKWHTWIDYPKFFELIKSGKTEFDALDYCAVTPSWAVFQSEQHGFDPNETRHYRKNRVVPSSGC